MAYAPIERGSTPFQVRENLVKLVNDFVEYSEKFHYSKRVRLPRLYEVWRGLYTGKYHPHKNNVHVPMIYSAIWADAARKAQASLSAGSIVTFRGYGPDDKPIALKNEALTNAQWADDQGFIKAVDTHVLSGLYGLAVSMLTWKRKYERATFDTYTAQPLNAEMVRQVHTSDVITYDGWTSNNIDLLDWYPDPGKRLIHDGMRRCAIKYYLDLDDVRRLSRPTPDGRPPIFDPAEVARLEKEGNFAGKVSSDVTDRRYMARLGMSDDMAKILDRYARPVECREYWGIIPEEMAINGETNVVITVLNRTYLGRARGNPFWHRRKPFHAHSPTPDPQEHWAAGKAEVAEKLNLTLNRWFNQRADAMDINIDPQIFYDRNAGILTEGLYSFPGQWIGTDGPPADKVWPLPVDLRGIQAGGAMSGELTAYIERATAIGDDVGQGLSAGPDRETAHANANRAAAQNVRLALETLLYERHYLEPKMNMAQRLNRQYLEGPVEVFMLGDNALKDPDTGKPIVDTRQTLEGYELAFPYTARAIGASSVLSRYMRRNELIPLLQAVSAQPAVAGAVNFVNFLREIFREFDFDNVNEMINQNAGAIQQQMAAIQGEGQGGVEGIPDTGQPADITQFLQGQEQ